MEYDAGEELYDHDDRIEFCLVVGGLPATISIPLIRDQRATTIKAILLDQRIFQVKLFVGDLVFFPDILSTLEANPKMTAAEICPNPAAYATEVRYSQKMESN